MGIERDVKLPAGKRLQRFLHNAFRRLGKGRRLRFRLIRRHQRTAAGIAEQHDLFDTGLLAQPLHADGNIDQRMFEQELIFRAAKARVPAEETVTAFGKKRPEIVFREIHIVVIGDESHAGPLALWSPVKALTGIGAVPETRGSR